MLLHPSGFYLNKLPMQNLNSFLVICALLVTANGINSSYAQDTEAQAKARQALRQKTGQIGEATVVSQDTPEQAKAREALRKKLEGISPTAAQSGAVSITMEPQRAPADPQTIEKARQAVRQKLDELSNGSPDSPEVAKAREAMRQKLTEATAVAVPVAVGTQNQEKATRAQEKAQIKTEKAMQTDSEKAEAAAQAERRAKYKSAVTPGAFQPIESPALPISNEKQQRLAELLKKYRADQLSPEEYHQERSKILAGQ
jgi:hypothetical protein